MNVFAGKARLLGATTEVYPQRYLREEQQRRRAFPAKTLGAAALLTAGFVARSVRDRCGYLPSLAPRHPPKCPAAFIAYFCNQALGTHCTGRGRRRNDSFSSSDRQKIIMVEQRLNQAGTS